MAVGDITSYIRNLVLPVVSLWDVSTSAVEVNRVLASLDETLGEDKPYRIMTKMIAYADKKQRETILNSLTEMHKDRASYEACGELGNILNHIASHYIVLLSSCMDKAPNPTINWHTAAFVRHERHYYIFSDRFNPSLYPTPNLNKPRIRDQNGLIQIYHLLSVLGLKKTESYPPVKAASKQSVKGRGFRIDGIWITGLGSTLLQCQKTATIFITQLMTGQVKLQDNGQPATGPYIWVEARM